MIKLFALLALLTATLWHISRLNAVSGRLLLGRNILPLVIIAHLPLIGITSRHLSIFARVQIIGAAYTAARRFHICLGG